MNVVLAQLAINHQPKTAPYLELGTRRSLEKCVKSLMNDVDELNKSVSAYNKYVIEKQRYDSHYNSLLQKRVSVLLFTKSGFINHNFFQKAENEIRQKSGEPLLPEDDFKKQLKPPQLMTRGGMLDVFLSASNASAYANYATEATNENIAKLFVSETAADAVEDTA